MANLTTKQEAFVKKANEQGFTKRLLEKIAYL